MQKDDNKKSEPYELVGELVAIFQRGNRWHVHYRLDGKPVRQSLKTNSKKQARINALAIERDLIAGTARRPQRAALIKDVVAQYVSHLEAQRRTEGTLKKYRFALKLALELAAKRGVSRIDQIDLAFIDAFKLERVSHRVQSKKANS